MARIADLLRAGPTFSFEFFPPATDEEQVRLVRTLRELEPLEPSFVSVTYRGGRSSRRRTHDLVAGMLRTTTLTPMAHLVCAAHTRLELAEILVDLRRAGVENLMALGGDPAPSGDQAADGDLPVVGELAHAVELVELARAIGGMSVGVAAQPAGHPRSPDLRTDRDFLAAKLERADFAVTQLFFEAEEYLGLMEDLAARGVDRPVVPGIMPVTTFRSVARMAEMGAVVPPELVARLEAAGPDPAQVRRVGVEWTTDLCRRLLAEGAPGLHFYTLNWSTATREIYAQLGLGPSGTFSQAESEAGAGPGPMAAVPG